MGTDGGAGRAAGVRLHLLVAGSCRHPGWVARRGGGLRSVAFPALVALIRHPVHGVILFDTGYGPRLRGETARLPASLYRYLLPVECRDEDTAAAQLRQRGIAPDDVGLVVVSHLHADHIGGLRDFPAARLVLSRTTLGVARRAAARTASATGRPRPGGTWRDLRAGLLPGLLPEDLAERAVAAEDHPGTQLPGFGPGLPATGFDLFGDGTVVALRLPGHAPGQVGLLVRPHDRPETLLVADACWSGRALSHGELPHPVTGLITDDRPGYRTTLAALAALTRRRPDLLVVPSHCAESIARATAALDGTGPR